ncbi:MAG: hypothetical protein JSU87_02910 [Gemmatimonadota bacterium]|nr:MAG: hypothetical protein JSU87_02910 [Gemmatimonadota bacterium]
MQLGKVRARLPLDAAITASPRGPATVRVYTTDDTLLQSLIELFPKRRYRMSSDERIDSLAEFVSDRGSDAVLIDLRLPLKSRIEAGRQIRNVRNRATIPVVGLCEASTSYEVRVAALGDGYWDVVELPAGSSELVAKLGNWICIKRDLAELRSSAPLDPESGHLTMRGMRGRLRELATVAQRIDDAMSCVVFGADEVPSRVSQDEGMILEAAREFSLALHQQTRSSDVISRLEPLKFMVLAPHTPPAGGVRLAERFTSLSLSRRVDGVYPMTFSAGTAGVYGQNGQIQAQPGLLFSAAHRALGEARRVGTAQVAAVWRRPS